MTMSKHLNIIDALLGTDDTKWMTPKTVKKVVDGEKGAIKISPVCPGEGWEPLDGRVVPIEGNIFPVLGYCDPVYTGDITISISNVYFNNIFGYRKHRINDILYIGVSTSAGRSTNSMGYVYNVVLKYQLNGNDTPTLLNSKMFGSVNCLDGTNGITAAIGGFGYSGPSWETGSGTQTGSKTSSNMIGHCACAFFEWKNYTYFVEHCLNRTIQITAIDSAMSGTNYVLYQWGTSVDDYNYMNDVLDVCVFDDYVVITMSPIGNSYSKKWGKVKILKFDGKAITYHYAPSFQYSRVFGKRYCWTGTHMIDFGDPSFPFVKYSVESRLNNTYLNTPPSLVTRYDSGGNYTDMRNNLLIISNYTLPDGTDLMFFSPSKIEKDGVKYIELPLEHFMVLCYRVRGFENEKLIIEGSTFLLPINSATTNNRKLPYLSSINGVVSFMIPSIDASEIEREYSFSTLNTLYGKCPNDLISYYPKDSGIIYDQLIKSGYALMFETVGTKQMYYYLDRSSGYFGQELTDIGPNYFRFAQKSNKLTIEWCTETKIKTEEIENGWVKVS